MNSEQKMREALERIAHKVATTEWARYEVEACAREALAQPAAVVELTDAEIYESYADGAGLFNRRIPFTEQEIRGLRAVIAAHEAKKNGGGV